MKTFISALCLFCLTAEAADVKVSDLPAATNPSTNTWFLISDMNAVTKSQKFLATNYVRQSQIDTSAEVQAILGQVYQATNGTLTTLSGATPTINGDLNVTGNITNSTTQTDTLYLSSLTETNKVIGIGATTNAMVATAAMVTNTLGMDLTSTLAQKVSTNTIVGSFGVTVDGGGSAVSTGIKGYITAPYSGHITGFSITSAGASPTCTWDVWKVASGTTLPAVGNTIMGTKPALSADNAVRSIAVSNWSTNFTAGDIIGFNLDANANGTNITFTLETLR